MKKPPKPKKDSPPASSPESTKDETLFDASKAPKFKMEEIEEIESEVAERWAVVMKIPVDSLKQLELRLPEDPVVAGMTKVHNLLSLVQEKQDTCKNFILSLLLHRGRLERLRSQTETIYDRRSARILMTMESVQALRNSTLQQAAVAQVLFRERRVLDDVTRKLEEVKTYLEMCRVVMDNLQATDRNLSRQIKVILVQVEIGEIKTVRGLPRGLRDEDNQS